MSIYESPAVIEERVANDVVSQYRLPESVDSIAVEFGIDYSDTPAMWLVFTLRPGAEEMQATYASVYALVDQIRDGLRDAGVERFAFVRFKRAASNARS